MATIQEAIALAYDLHRQGRRAEAETLYGRILDADPGNATALLLFGVLLADAGQWEEAAARLEAAAAADGGNVDAQYNLALALHRLGRPEEAQARYRAVIRLAPGHAAAHNNLGLLLRNDGRDAEAADAFRAAGDAQPGFAEAWFNLGVTLANRGDAAEAITAFDRAHAANPTLDAARENRERLRDAVARAAESRLQDGVARIREGRRAEGAALLRECFALAPDDPAMPLRAGLAVAEAAPALAMALYRAGVMLAPDNRHAQLLLGMALHGELRMMEALAHSHSHRGVARGPGDGGANAMLGNALFGAGMVEEAIVRLERAVGAPGASADVADSLLFAMLASPAVDNERLFASALEMGRRFAPTVPAEPHPNTPDPDRPLRIGYVSGAIHEGSSILGVLEPLLKNHDRSRVSVFIYGDVDYAAPTQARVVGMVDGARDLRGLDDAAAARRIRDDRIDVLVSLLGRGSVLPRNGVFLHRPAPVQAASLHVMTTGAPTMDYWLTDPHASPRGATERFTERVVRMPRFCPYQPIKDAPDPAPAPALRNGWVTFGCFTSRWKIAEPVVEAWARIMAAVPGSRLLLKGDMMDQPEFQAFQRGRFAAHGVAPERLMFRGRDRTPREHLDAYGAIDLALDTFPYTYGTTAFEALWMGVPVVSLAGDRFAARISCSLLHAAGVGDWVAHTPDAYVDLACRLASDLEELARIREGLRGRVARSRLLDGRGYARAMERVYRWAWRRWCAAAR